jgi:predicted PurR-regulated permease PerM
MLGLPPETVYHHVREGAITAAGLGLVLVVMIAWRMGQLATLAPILLSGALLAMLTPTVLMVQRRYRHVLAAVLVLAMLLGLLAAAVHHYGYPVTLALVVGPTPSAVADAVSPR